VLLNGVVYTSWSSHWRSLSLHQLGDRYNQTTLARVSILNLTPNGNDGGIWGAGSGPAADAARICICSWAMGR